MATNARTARTKTKTRAVPEAPPPPRVRKTSAGSTPKATEPAPPPRAAARPADVAGQQASVNRYLAAYIMGVANRLANGASNYYRQHFNLGMSEWRAMMAVGGRDELIVREVAEMADLDYAAASKSVRVLEERGFVSVEQTRSRGRAAIVRLTPAGAKTYVKLRDSAQERQDRLVAEFTPQEVETLWALLRRVEQQVPSMNAE
ncbi:MarR family winged helix-turn-helix transcriptional regulator [Variovorax sp. YR216]|uniref:MarR family winged helix-turn-helix transcriptional regulator n=1 Tax=Variovorax sp. YR216 TaxID=1882828 RepID=UPI0008973856|nr:MarR family winged helix-turn-helix transcriptional regulator [Variovorax sp. YR216]SEB14521.1 DNA-binding transcriptional regulator, MarR family [Variovorax sp. YR216]